MSKKFDCIVSDKVKSCKWAFLMDVFLVNPLYLDEFKKLHTDIEGELL